MKTFEDVYILKNTIYEILNNLPEKEKTIIEMRYGLNGYTETTLEDVGKKYNYSRQYIKQVQDKIEIILKNEIQKILNFNEILNIQDFEDETKKLKDCLIEYLKEHYKENIIENENFWKSINSFRVGLFNKKNKNYAMEYQKEYRQKNVITISNKRYNLNTISEDMKSVVLTGIEIRKIKNELFINRKKIEKGEI